MTAFSFKINIKVSVCGFERDDPGEPSHQRNFLAFAQVNLLTYGVYM